MGFSIFACVIAGVMFICYAVTLSDYSKLKHCERTHGIYYSSYHYWGYDCYRKYDMKRETAANVAGLGSCLLIFSIVEFFLALTASIYCCASVCCNTPSGAVRNVSWDTQLLIFACKAFFNWVLEVIRQLLWVWFYDAQLTTALTILRVFHVFLITVFGREFLICPNLQRATAD